MLLYNCILSFARLEERLRAALILVASGLEKLSKEAESVRWNSLLPHLLSLYHLFLPATTSADNIQVQYYLQNIQYRGVFPCSQLCKHSFYSM